MAELLGVQLEKAIHTDFFQEVWQGTAAGRRFAVHVLAESLRGTPVGQGFRDGARRLFAFRAGGGHRGVVKVHAVADDGNAFVADLWTLGSMADVSALRWDVRRRVALFRDVAEALGALHVGGVVHGCMRPSNVLFDDDLRPVLTDIGLVDIALALGGDEGGAHGYGVYASPEARYGMPVDVRADVFSAGRLLHFLLEDATPPEAAEPLPRLESIAATAPPGLVRIVRKCVQSDPAARYGSMEALLADLGRWEDAASVGVGHPDVPERGGPAPDATGDRLSLDRVALREMHGGGAAGAPAAAGRVSGASSAAVRVPVSGSSTAAARVPVSGSSTAAARVPAAGASSVANRASSVAQPAAGALPRPSVPPASASRAAVRARPGAPGSRRPEARDSATPSGMPPGKWSSTPPPKGKLPLDPLESLGAKGRIGLAAAGGTLLLAGVGLAAVLDLPAALGVVAAVGGALTTAAIPATGGRARASRVGYAALAFAVVFAIDLPSRVAAAVARRAVSSEDLAARTAAVRALVLRGQRELDGVQLEGADLHDAALAGISLQGANLRRVDFRGANLLRGRLVGADVTGAQFAGASLTGADLRGTALGHAIGVDLALCDAGTQWPEGWSCVGGKPTSSK